MVFKSLEDLQIFQQAVDAADAVSNILIRPCFDRDFQLRDQLRDASDGVPSHISEGFGQKTDRHFAHYLFIARGSCNEIRSHLVVARSRKCINAAECDGICERYVRIGKGITRLIQHLRREDRKDRG